ncbi:PfkB family carbohydrate kinase, partial [bacterium]|nr:PfkB family carbohydrate kinase [bacterium]
MPISDKIVNLDDLPNLLSGRRENKKVCHCHGVFDLLHIGHIRHFGQAKGFGDLLVVTVTPDRFVNKGPHRPVFTESLRAEAVAALDCVDYVAINKWPMATNTIKLLRPNIYVKGSDYKDASQDVTGGIALERKAVASVGGEIVFTDDITFSSSHLLNHHLSALSKPTSEFIWNFARRQSAGEVIETVKNANRFRVLVIGETIIDEYHYCETIGKSGKEPVLAAKYLSSERFAGGISAVANNVASVCDQVGMLTFLGEKDSHEAFICEKLNPKIEKMFLSLRDAPTIVKRRFLEVYPLQKMFEVYIMNGTEEDAEASRQLCHKLESILPQYDVVIVTDYGHGMLGADAVELLCKQAKFLAINTQLNAANHGYNTVSKYHHADYICVSEKEIRLDARSRRRDLKDIVLEVSQKLACGHIVITRGENGCLCYGKKDGFFEVPAFTNHVVD